MGKVIPKFDGLPSLDSTDPLDVHQAKWIERQRINKNRNPELDKIAAKYGFSDVFKMYDLKSIALDQAEKIAKRSNERGELPKLMKEDHQQYNDARWINTKKYAKRGTCSAYWYPEIEDIFSKYGFYNVFYNKDMKSVAIEQANDIAKWAQSNGHLPKRDASKSDIENKYYLWIHNRKRAKVGLGTVNWYPEIDDIFAHHGFPYAFKRKDLKSTTFEQANIIIKHAKERGQLPTQNTRTDNIQYNKESKWLGKRRTQKWKNKYTWSNELENLFAFHGFPNALQPIDVKTEVLKKAEDIAKRAKMRGYLPSPYSDDQQEKRDAGWISDRKHSKHFGRTHKGTGAKEKSGIWYSEFEKIFDSYGFPTAFEQMYR